MISKACVVGAYQSKLEHMAAAPDLELTVVVPPYWRQGGQRLPLERVHTSGYRLIVTPMALNGSFHLHFYPFIGRILREARPDLCHIDEEPYNLATYLTVRAARRLGLPSVFFTWQNIARPYPPPFRQIERYVYAHTLAAIAGNRDAAEVLRAKGYDHTVHVIPQFGVDPERFAPRPQPRGEGGFTIGYAGRLVEEKGLWVLAHAVSALGGDWCLLLVGDGPLRRPLRAYFAERGLADRVRFRRRVPSLEMPQAYHQMDLLVLPSLTRPNWREQFGRVLIEAMACEVPVVGSDSGEIPHVIGSAGLCFPEGDADALRRVLGELRAQPELRRTLGRRGRQRVLAHYTQARIAERTLAFYRTVLA